MNFPYIIFEGIDYSGKTTQARKLVNYLLSQEGKGPDVLFTREPWISEYGKKIKEILKNSDIDPMTKKELCLELYIKDRKEHMFYIRNNYGKTIIIQDRGMYSTLAYQGAQGVRLDKILSMHKFMEDFPKPDVVLLFDLPFDVLIERMKEYRKETTEMFEKQEFLKQVFSIYQKLEEYFPNHLIVRIDASRSIEKVFENILSVIKERKIF